MVALSLAADRLLSRPIDELLASNGDLIARLKLSFGFDRATFEREVMPLIQAYAGYVGWLPATEADLFDRPGGLFRLGLETAFYSVQGTDAHIFSGRSTISARRQLEPRWRQATFIAGLCGELHRALGLVEVRDESGTPWPAYLHPLSSWMRGPGQLRWHAAAHETRSLGLLVLPQIVPSTLIQHLAENNDLIVPHLLASIGGLPLYRGRNVLDDLVRRAFALVVERDLRAHGKHETGNGHGHHQTRYLIEGMQRLIARDSAWQPNREKSRVWYACDGLYLIWPGAAQDLYRLLEGEQIAGMPDAPDAILACLLDAGLIVKPSEDDALWHIRPPATGNSLQAIKFASPALLLSSVDASVEPLEKPLAPISPPSPAAATEPAGNPQLSLVDVKSARSPSCAATPLNDTPPPIPHWQLKAPLRLNAAVRHALASSLAEPAGEIMPLPKEHALFFPLHRFDVHRIAPAIAIRALSELGMLVPGKPDAPPTVKRLNNTGEPVVGILLKERFIETAAAAVPLTPEEPGHADAPL
jgi:conjugal transfer pilus assembly protein TraI